MGIKLSKIITLVLSIIIFSSLTQDYLYAQSFDFEELEKKVNQFTVIIDVKIEYSFGIHTNEQEERYLGTIISDDGLVIFNGTALSSEGHMPMLSGLNVKTTPTDIVISTLDGNEYSGEYIGVDRFTKIGFLQIKNDSNEKFKSLNFKHGHDFKIGNWVALYTLLPDYINPPLAADIGMISTLIKTPEYFPLTVGFNSLQLVSILFDENLEAVGVLGKLSDPLSANMDPGGMLESFNQMRIPMLGIITTDKLEKLIANPPQKGKVDRGWLGITLQALTLDMAKFWSIDLPGGIIVNDVVGNSPAKEAGLEVGDIIYEINSQQVDVDKEEKIPVFQRKIAEMGPDAEVEFSVMRRDNGNVDSLKLLVTLQKAPIVATDAPEYKNDALELKVRELVFYDYLYHNLEADKFNGVVVSELKQGGVAELEGLYIGDIIQSIGNQPVSSIEDVEKILTEAENNKDNEIIFFVWRNQKTLFVNVKTDWPAP